MGQDHPDAELHPHATGEAAKTVESHQKDLPLKLYSGWFCPFVQRAWMVLELKNIPYQYKEINPYHKSRELLDLNPRGLVPTLQFDNRPLYESTVICEFLEEEYSSHKPSLLPTSTFEKARARIWIDFVGSRVISSFHRFLQCTAEGDELDGHRQDFLKILKEFTEAMDGEGPFFLGKEVSLVDVTIAPWAIRLWIFDHFKEGGLGLDGQSGAWVKRWGQFVKAVEDLDCVKATTSEREHYLPIYKRYADNTAQKQTHDFHSWLDTDSLTFVPSPRHPRNPISNCHPVPSFAYQQPLSLVCGVSRHRPSFNIPSQHQSRRSSDIQLTSLSLPTSASQAKHASSPADNNKQSGRSSLSRSDSGDSDFLSDDGDLALQLDDEDPLTAHLRENVPENYIFKGKNHTKPSRHVRYEDQEELLEDHKAGHPGFTKEDIEIPQAASRNVTRAEHLLAVIMTGERQMHGLTGKPLVYFTSVFVSLGVFLFGYDQGVMSGIITGPHFKDYFNQPSRAEVGTMVAILEIGAFISSLVVGRVGDIIGRRKTILYGSMIFFVGGALQSFANGMPMMLLGRIIAGVGVGMLSTIVPVYQSEISPPHNRGKLACIEFSGNIIGYAASVWVDYFCSYIESDMSWRIPLVMQCVMGALLGFGSLIIVESPRWLLDNDHDEEGIVVIANLYGGGDIHNPKARDEFREIKMDVLMQRQEGERTYKDMFTRYRTRVFIAMSAQAFAQLNGINVISYYAPLVFESAGWVGRSAILMTGINGITYFLSTIPPWYLVDRLGRRKILLSGAVMMAIALSSISYFIFLDIPISKPLVVISVMVYNAAFGFSWGPIPWLYPPEILPLSIRSKGASLSTATNWAFNWVVGELTPVLQGWIGWRLYLVHAFFCSVSFILVYFIYPETCGVRLEDMDMLFGDATTAMGTPATRAERGSLIGSPVPSMDLRGRQAGASAAIPGLDINPPAVSIVDGKPVYSKDETEGGGASWISRMVSRTRGEGSGAPSVRSGQYKPVGQDDR